LTQMYQLPIYTAGEQKDHGQQQDHNEIHS
jgi:hypothetical protein